jgi:hypothetical protein
MGGLFWDADRFSALMAFNDSWTILMEEAVV